jgi:hypothetical protein
MPFVIYSESLGLGIQFSSGAKTFVLVADLTKMDRFLTNEVVARFLTRFAKGHASMIATGLLDARYNPAVFHAKWVDDIPEIGVKWD